MFFRRKKEDEKEIVERTKINVPKELKLEIDKLKREKEEKAKALNGIRYSLSPSPSTIDKAKTEIKNTVLEPSFKEVLFGFIDKKGLTDPEIYKKAQVDKRTFSRIRKGKATYVSRNTVIRLGLALELNFDDFTKLLKANRNWLYEGDYFGIAIKWCINNKVSDIEQVNDILYSLDLPLID